MTRAELDANLKQAVAVGTPVEVVDPTMHEVFYLVSAEQFRVIATAIAGDLDPCVAYPLVDEVMSEDDLHDPLLDSYQ